MSVIEPKDPMDPPEENQDKNHEDDLEQDDEELENFITDFDPDNVDADEDVVTLPKEDFEKLTKGVNNLKTTIKQKQHWKKKATSPVKPSITKSPSTMSNPIEQNKEAIKNNEEQKPAVTPAPEATPQQKRDVEKELDIINLTQRHPYLESEADNIVSRARQLGISVEQVLKDPMFAPFVEQKQKEYKISHVSMGSNSPGSPVNTGEEKDWANVPKEDILKKNQEVMRRRSQ